MSWIPFLIVLTITLVVLAILLLCVRNMNVSSPKGQIGLAMFFIVILTLFAGMFLGTFPSISAIGDPFWTTFGSGFHRGGGRNVKAQIASPDAAQYSYNAVTGTLSLGPVPNGYDHVIRWKGGANPPDDNGYLVASGTTTYVLGPMASSVEVMFQTQDRSRPMGTPWTRIP